MTEFGMGLSQPYDTSLRVKCSVGQPMTSVRARLRHDNQVTEVTNTPGTDSEGDLEILSPGLFSGYWQEPEKTAEEFTGFENFYVLQSKISFLADNWFKTGDRAGVKNGAAFILGRNSVDIIKSGGYKSGGMELF